MALTLDAEVGGTAANAYADLDAYTAYAEGRVGAPTLTDEQIEQALVTATADIDTLEYDPGLLGDRYSTTQALAFPRTVATLPAALVRATIEQAMSYAPAFASGATVDVLNATAGNGNIKRKKTGPLETEYFAANVQDATPLSRFAPVVQRLLWSLVVQTPANAWGSSQAVRAS